MKESEKKLGKIKLTFEEALLLHSEISGGNGEKEFLLGKPMNQKIKYKLAKLHLKLQEEKTIFEQRQEELIRKYGKQNKKENRIEVIPNTKEYEEYIKEIREMLEIELEFDFVKLNLEDLDFESERTFILTFEKLIEE